MQAYKQSWTQLYVKKNYILHQINIFLSLNKNKAGTKQRKSYTRSIVTMAILTISSIQTTWLD